MALPFTSRRSPVVCRHGCVACSQPLAAEIGLQVLRRGGNAADAAVAVAAALNVTEPCSTGIGGDCFCLFYDAGSKEVQGINGRYLSFPFEHGKIASYDICGLYSVRGYI